MATSTKIPVKSILVTAAGVMLAGFLMHQFRGTGAVDQARGGFN